MPRREGANKGGGLPAKHKEVVLWPLILVQKGIAAKEGLVGRQNVPTIRKHIFTLVAT